MSLSLRGKYLFGICFFLFVNGLIAAYRLGHIERLQRRCQMLDLSKALMDVSTREYRTMRGGGVGLSMYVMKLKLCIWCNIDFHICRYSIYVLALLNPGLIFPDGPIFPELVLIMNNPGLLSEGTNALSNV